MNCEQANRIDLIDLLDRLGFTPQKRVGKEYQFISPFRPHEKKGSFFVSQKGWFDHGEGRGSTTNIDFIQIYLESQGRSSSVSDALKFIKSLGYGGGDTAPLFVSESSKTLPEIEEESDLEFIRVKPVTHKAIFEYLQGRGIKRDLILKYLVEVDYLNKKQNKNYFAFAISNELGGYEIRSASDKYNFKSSLIEKSFTFIEGQVGKNTLNIFEGVTDFLSLLMSLNCDSLNGDTLILNSLSSAKRAIEFINSKTYKHIHLWLDNDEAGKKMVSRFENELHTEVLDQSFRYAPHKDINLALQAQKEHLTFLS